MMENLNEYLDKRLGLRKCQGDICQKYNIRHSENGHWALPDIKRAYGKMQHSRANTNRDGLSVILVKQIQQHLQKCETDVRTKQRKQRRTEVEIDNEEEYEENGERRTRTVTKVVKKYVPYRTYQPATPEQVDKWSKDLPDVYKQQRKDWQFLQRLQKIYNLHPLDGVMIVNVNLRDNAQKRLTESVERRIEVNWAKITSCMQKTGESVAEYEEHFIQIWLEYAGVNNNEDLSKDTGMPLKTAFVNGLKPEISKAHLEKYAQ
ncbi:hypothetical protein DPX16_0266 [Anabarilius grahami]|uniref:Uncharacterized protein n=1 Tax=Anabarilius grahami TaxID=495550 RepID=A0A3N0Z3N6_ANAGA|nr:hypothetical protein DPX16_0266 [Anabarilius grahami]